MERWKWWQSAFRWVAGTVAGLFVFFEFMMGMGCSWTESWVFLSADAVAEDRACIEAALSDVDWIHVAAKPERTQWAAHVYAARTPAGGVKMTVSVPGSHWQSKRDSVEVAAALGVGLARRCPALREGGTTFEVSKWRRRTGFIQTPL